MWMKCVVLFAALIDVCMTQTPIIHNSFDSKVSRIDGDGTEWWTFPNSGSLSPALDAYYDKSSYNHWLNMRVSNDSQSGNSIQFLKYVSHVYLDQKVTGSLTDYQWSQYNFPFTISFFFKAAADSGSLHGLFYGEMGPRIYVYDACIRVLQCFDGWDCSNALTLNVAYCWEDSEVKFTKNQWYSVVVVLHNQGNLGMISLYMDGTLKKQVAASYYFEKRVWQNQGRGISHRLGLTYTENSKSVALSFAGKMDEFKMFTLRTLNSTEIANVTKKKICDSGFEMQRILV